jgi:hypothetical protein
LLPKFRTEDYAIWRACERLSIRPPDVKDWDDCSVWVQAMIIAYSHIRDYEDQERDIEFMKSMGAKVC